MQRVVILGAGGHAKVVADILFSRDVELVGFLDDDPQTWETRPLGIPVLGATSLIFKLEASGAIIGIGANAARKLLASRLGLEHLWCNAIHQQCTVASSVQLGIGVVVAARAVVNPDCVIGSHVIINTGATVDHDCLVGDYSHIAPGVHLAGGVRVGEGSLVGIGAIVLPNCSIGGDATIGAGAVVVRDVPDGATVKGIPAR